MHTYTNIDPHKLATCPVCGENFTQLALGTIMNRITSLLLAALVFLVVTAPAHAQDPTPTPGGDLPYDFTPYEYEKGVSPAAQLNIFNNPTFINSLGKTTTTMMTFFDDQMVLAIFVIILLALWLLWGIAKFVYNSPSKRPMGRIVEPDDSEAPEEYDLERRYSSNPYRVYRQRLVKRK